MRRKNGRPQVDQDVVNAWANVANCLLYENDPGPEQLNIGTADAPLMVPRSQAWQHNYAREVMIATGADLDRLRAAARECVVRGAAAERPAVGRQYARAADLCELAAEMVIRHGAASSGARRLRLLAIAEHDSMVTALGAVPGIEELAQATLEGRLRKIDAECGPADDVPDFVRYSGPSYDPATGRFVIGRGAGGVPWHWTLNTPGAGVEHGLIVGPRGIGKSNLITIVLVDALQSGRFDLMTADPSGRGQLPGPLEPAVAPGMQAADVRGTKELLRAAIRVVQDRSGAAAVDPTPDRRDILVAIEECHTLFADDLETTALAELIVREGGPAGVSLVVTAPGVDLANFGGSLALRTGLSRVNAALMGADGNRMAAELLRQR